MRRALCGSRRRTEVEDEEHEESEEVRRHSMYALDGSHILWKFRSPFIKSGCLNSHLCTISEISKLEISNFNFRAENAPQSLPPWGRV